MSESKVDGSKHEINKSPVSVRRTKKLLILTEYLSKQESRNNSKKVSRILKKSELERTDEDKATLARNLDIVKRIHKNRERRRLTEQRILETEDGEEVLQIKCEKLAKILQQSKRTVIYTGAGISTAASIPDYRGPQGVWTLLQKGEQLVPQDLSDAEPTMTHMCITRLHELGHVQHVVSQNCDGLHLRSDFPRPALSEVHGNMFIEICHTCKPHREYIRLFDVTENTGVRRHFTGRHCQKCGGKLKDTIVHFGEKGGMKSPYRWKEAVRAANKCDLILCLGTSLKILKKYACLWCMDRVKHKRPNLVIVNLQWTPKDESATLKINGRCDDVMERVMKILGYVVPQYSRLADPIFHLAASLSTSEMQTTSKKVLQRPEGLPHLRSRDISRTPSPCDSDSCSSGTSSATSASNETSADDAEDLIDVEDILPDLSVDEALSETEKTEEVEPGVKLPTKEELYMSKSERICNEAKIAMQTKLVNAQIQEVFSSCQAHQEQHIKDISKMLTDNNDRLNSARISGMNGFVNDSGTTSSTLQPSAPYDPLRGGPFDPGPASYKEKVAYLHVLQNQLEALKQKQIALKEQEFHQYKHKHQIVPSQVNMHNVRKSNTIVNCHSLCFQQETSKVNTKVIRSKKISTKCEDVASFLASREKKESDGICGEISELHTYEKSLLQQKKAILNHKEQEECSLMRQHQNEQLRLQQHCLIQEQILQQTNHCTTSTDELLKVFLFQQQLLITQQNAQLHILGQKFHQKMEKLDQDFVKKQREIAQKSHYLNNLEKVEQESEHKVLNPLVSILKGCSNDISYSSLQYGIYNQKRQKIPKVVLTGKNKQDCRIVTVLQNIPEGVCLSDSPSPSAMSKIPNLNKLVENLSTCESCRFLKSCNFTKQQCSQCDILKAKHGITQSPANVSKFVFLSCKGTDNLTGTSALHNTQLCVNSVVLNKALVNCKTETNVNSTGNNVKEAFPKRDSDSINNEQSNLFALDSSLMLGNSCHMETLTRATSPLKQEILTQKVDENVINIVMSTSTCQQITLQDVDNNARDLLHINVRKAEQAKKDKGNLSTCENREVTVSCIDFKLNYEDESIDIINDTKINVSKGKDAAGNYCEEIGPKTATRLKTIRSCSHSSIYDAHKCCLSGDIPGVKQLWSHSHSGLNNEKSVAVCVTVAESINDCIIDSDGTDNANDQSGQNRTMRKRKLLRCPSAPGWFGKGLNLKRRRKY